MHDKEILQEFLVESYENLARLDQELVELERRPGDTELLSSIFRTIHTVKGTCGFLGFSTLEKITHVAENLLSDLRNGKRALNPTLTSAILQTVDTIKHELAIVESSGGESSDTHHDLIALLTALSKQEPDSATAALFEEESQPDPVKSTELSSKLSAEAETSAKSSAADSTIRVDVALLERLMNRVGELVLTRNEIAQLAQTTEGAIQSSSQRLSLITAELQADVMKTRMQPVGSIWNRLPRVVRDIAAACGKQISLELIGKDTELDRSVVEAIKDPLVHLVRNACDHGIEQPDVRIALGKSVIGTLTLRAFHSGGQVHIEIQDDGAGIDADAVKAKAVQKGLLQADEASRISDREAWQLICLPGFSTAKEVTNISGRGVGMDVVKTNIEKIGGALDILSSRGAGSTFRMRIPLTLAIIPGLVVSTAGQSFIIPQVNVLELVRVADDNTHSQIENLKGTLVYRLRGDLLPLVNLAKLLGFKDRDCQSENIIVLEANEQRFGLIVDEVNDTQEIVVKPIGRELKKIGVYSGATIMGDGRVALILDSAGIAQNAGLAFDTGKHGSKDQVRVARTSALQQTFLICSAEGWPRLAFPLSLTDRLEMFPLSQVETAAGSMAVQYRGQILSLFTVNDVLDPDKKNVPLKDPLPVIVFASRNRRLGMIVGDIVDIVTGKIAGRHPSSRVGVICSAVIGDQIHDLLDIQTLLKSVDPGFFTERKQSRSAGLNVLLQENNNLIRSILRYYLELAGHSVHDVSGFTDAQSVLAHRKCDLVVAAHNPSANGFSRFLADFTARQNQQIMPVVWLTDSAMDERPPDRDGLLERYEVRFDRKAMLSAVDTLILRARAQGPLA